MLGKIFNTFFPMREFLNYLFKKTLGDYILNDLDLNKIEIEISNKAFISLKNIDLNAADINKKHLENCPFLMLEGQIKKFDLSFSLDKISINIDKLNILLMPIFNKEKSKNLISKKQIPVTINESLNNNPQKEFTNFSKENCNNEFSLVSSFLNSALNNLEINISNISVSILSYEASNTFQENHILTFFISEICFRKKNEDDIKMIQENKNFHDNNNDRTIIKNFSKLKNENSENNNNDKTNNNNKKEINITYNKEANDIIEKDNQFQNKDKKSNYNNTQTSVTFLSDKILLVDKIILRIHQQDQKIENEFFEMTNENEEKLNFNFFCNNSSILAFDYKTTGYSLLIDFIEVLDPKNKINDLNCNLMDVNIDLRKVEICINPLQLQILMNFIDIFKMISIINEKDFKESGLIKETDGEMIKNNIKILKPMKILRTILSRFSVNLFFEGINLILLETNYMKDLPKLWSFYQENYNKKIDNIHALESHFSYMEDNFFLINLCKSKVKMTQDFISNKEIFEFFLEKIYLKYTEYLGKKKIIPVNNVTHCKLSFNNSFNINNAHNFMLKDNFNNINNSKILFNSQIQKSKNYFNNNSRIYNNLNNINSSSTQINNNIYASNVFYMDKSMNRSNLSIYESVRDYEEANNIDNSTLKVSLNNTIYQSTLESKDALLERYNIIFESEYLHESHAIFELSNNSITENICLIFKTYKDYYILPQNNNNMNSNSSGLELNVSQNINKIQEVHDVDFAEKYISSIIFADYSKTYSEIILKKISLEFNPLYLYKITKLVFFTQIILNEFLYLLDNNNNNNINNTKEIKSKSFKSEADVNNKIRKGSDSESFIDKSVYRDDYEEKLEKIYFSNQEKKFDDFNNDYDSKTTNKESLYFRGCYDKSSQILIILEELNLKIKTLKKDFYDQKGNCKTNINCNLTEEFKSYEEFAKNYYNSQFLSQYILQFFQANVNPFFTNIENNIFNRNIIGKKQQIKLDKQMQFYYINKDFLELNISNHRILINNKNEKIEKIFEYNNSKNTEVNQYTDKVYYINSFQKILYIFDTIQINFGTYNILKLKRDFLNFSHPSRNEGTNSIYLNKINDVNPKKIFEFENSYYESNEVKKTSIYKKSSKDLEEKISRNNLYFRLSPIVIYLKKTAYPEDSNDEEINFAFRKEHSKADDKIKTKINNIYSKHNLNLIQNINFDDSKKSSNKEEAPSFMNKIIEKIEMNINLMEDFDLTLEPQYINKIIPFFDSLMFSLNMHKLLNQKIKEIFNFYKQIYFVSLNIENFNDFDFYYKNNEQKNNEIENDIAQNCNLINSQDLKFSAISVGIKSINLFILRNNTDDYANLIFKSEEYTDYLLKLSVIEPCIDLFSKNGDSNLIVSINDMRISLFKKKDDYFNCKDSPPNKYNYYENKLENIKSNEIMRELVYFENMILYKGDRYYGNLNNIVNHKSQNQKADPEKNIEKYFKKNIQNSILTLVLKFKQNPKAGLITRLTNQNSFKIKNNDFNEELLNSVIDEKDVNQNNINIINPLENLFTNFQDFVKNNLMPQSDTNLDIIIISNDAIFSPLTYPNFDLEEIKTILKEFGFDKLNENKDPPTNNQQQRQKTLEIKLDDISEKFHKTINSKEDSISFKAYDKSELKLDYRDSSSQLEINLQNNLENLINFERTKDSGKNFTDLYVDGKKIFEKNEKLINLFDSSSLNMDFNIDINRLSFDIFIEEEKNLENKNLKEINNDKSKSISNKRPETFNINFNEKVVSEKNKRKKNIRGLIHIEKITHFKEINYHLQRDSNVIKRNLMISNFNLYFLKNLDHPYAEYDILKLNNGRFHEDSIFKYLGFVEILNLNYINISFTRELLFEFIENEEKKRSEKEILFPNIYNDIAIKIGDISIFLCKDTLEASIEFANCLIAKSNSLKDIFIDKDKQQENLCNEQNNDLNKKFKLEEIDDLKENEISYKKSNRGNVIINEDYSNDLTNQTPNENCSEKSNLKNLIFVDNYCNENNNLHIKDFDLEYEKLENSLYIKNNYNDKISVNDNRMSIISKNLNKDCRKEETIIFFDLKSLKIFIYKGNDFNFIEDSFKESQIQNNNNSDLKIDSINENIKNDNVIMILSNSFFKIDKFKDEYRETIYFSYDEGNNSIILDPSKIINNYSNQMNNNINKDFNLFSKEPPLMNNDNINFENSNLQIIERFYFCQDKDFKKIILDEEKSNLNYLEFEKKLARKKKNPRDYNNHICINIETLKTKFSFYKNNEKISMNIYLNKLDIDDYVKNSKYKKIISKYIFENYDNIDIYENSRNSKKINKYKNMQDKPLLDFDVDIVKINEDFKLTPSRKASYDPGECQGNYFDKYKKNSKYTIKENVIININKGGNVDNIDILDIQKENKKLENDLIYIDGFISPLNILIDQATLVFILEFFLIKDSKIDEAKININKNNGNNNNFNTQKNINYKKIKDPLNSNKKAEKKSNQDIETQNTDNNDFKENKVFTQANKECNSSDKKPTPSTDSFFIVDSNSTGNNEINNDKKISNKKKAFLKNTKISEFFILFSYNAHSISLSKLSNKEYLELLNFSNISELKIDFKRYEYNNFLPIEDFPKNIINFWINDLKKEKTKVFSSVINSLGFIKPFSTMMSGFFNVIFLPYKNYIKDKSLTSGLFGEFKNFLLNFTSQSLFLGEKTFLVFKKLISGGENTNLDKNSYYKKFLYKINNEKKIYEEYYYK